MKIQRSFFSKGFSALGFVMVVATITLVGFVAFRFLDAQDNTEVAMPEPATSQVANLETAEDVDEVTQILESAELDSLDAELDEQFAF
jgi:hypothetical protein